jgi:hypothetical protein
MHGEMKSSYDILVGEPEEKRLLAKSSIDGKIILK